MIGYLKEDIIIHRLCSGPNRDKLIYPKWAGDKARVISSIQKYLKDNDIYQGKFYKGDDKDEEKFKIISFLLIFLLTFFESKRFSNK